MNSASVLVAQIRARGVQLKVDGDRVRFHPRSKVSAELVAALAQEKAEVIALLRGESAVSRPVASTGVERPRTVPCRSCGSSHFWALASIGYWVCAGCHAPDFAPSELAWMSVETGGGA